MRLGICTPLLYARCRSRRPCAAGLPSARLEELEQGPAELGTGRAGTVDCLPRGSRSLSFVLHCCMETVGKAEVHTGKAARHAGLDARSAGRSARRPDYGQKAAFQNALDEGRHG